MEKQAGKKETGNLIAKQEKARKSKKMTFMEYESLMERYSRYFDKFGN